MAVPASQSPPPITVFHFVDDGTIPNSRLPLVVYHAAIEPHAANAEAFEALFSGNGWLPAWRNGIYPVHHYHSTAHEALGIAEGRARIVFGGPEGNEVEVAAGDAIVIPAGTGHKLVEASEDLLVIGAYPQNQDWDLLKGEPRNRPAADANIARVPLPASDPVSGVAGALGELWS